MSRLSLARAAVECFAKDTAEHATAMDFMMHKVKPEMAQMLGQAEYSETNKEGFGCMECHTAAQ